MRELISLSDRQQALRLAAYLAVQSIEATAEEDDGQWIVWVHSDDDRDAAAAIAEEFQQNPSAEKYENAERKVRHVLREADRLRKETRRKDVSLQKRWDGSWWHCYPATYIMIGLSILVALLCTDFRNAQGGLGLTLCNKEDSKLLNLLNVQTPILREKNGVAEPHYFVIPNFPANRLDPTAIASVLTAKAYILGQNLMLTAGSGEVWRWVTPAFLHFSLLHILFNMMWLKSIGGVIEYVRGTKRFVLLCLVLAVTSNIAQLYWSGPFFGGMSGVVFGLIGYVWMKGKTQPHLGLGLLQQTVVFAILWLLLCMAGVFGPIANAAHVVGFLTGILIGARQAVWKKLPFTR